MERYEYILKCHLQISSVAFVEASKRLEIGIPCTNCRRVNRTIRFEESVKNGICTPSNECGNFPGILTAVNVNIEPKEVIVEYIIDFEFEKFIDRKFNIEYDIDGWPKWARINFCLKCLNCGKLHVISTQENLVRPRNVTCECGASVYYEQDSPFQYHWKKKN